MKLMRTFIAIKMRHLHRKNLFIYLTRLLNSNAIKIRSHQVYFHWHHESVYKISSPHTQPEASSINNYENCVKSHSLKV